MEQDKAVWICWFTAAMFIVCVMLIFASELFPIKQYLALLGCGLLLAIGFMMTWLFKLIPNKYNKKENREVKKS